MTLAVRLDAKLEKRLTKLANETHRTKTYYVSRALENYLEDMEDMYTALYRLENPSGPYRTMEEVKRELGLENTVGSKSRKKSKKTRPRRPKSHHPVS